MAYSVPCANDSAADATNVLWEPPNWASENKVYPKEETKHGVEQRLTSSRY